MIGLKEKFGLSKASGGSLVSGQEKNLQEAIYMKE
jgi:hypothetical protein